ncbi:MAG TPA: hypothetical protein PLI96_11330 [Halothiobacillus sp.]|nr:hypothetical protein [Halothiobacillus sp.]
MVKATVKPIVEVESDSTQKMVPEIVMDESAMSPRERIMHLSGDAYRQEKLRLLADFARAQRAADDARIMRRLMEKALSRPMAAKEV